MASANSLTRPSLTNADSAYRRATCRKYSPPRGNREHVDEAARLRALHRLPPLRGRPRVHARRRARALRQQHLRPVQPLARSRRRRLAGPADGVHRADRAPDRRLAAGRHDRPRRRPGRRRVPSALSARSRRTAGPSRSPTSREVQHFVERGAFSPDGTKLAYAANARTPTDMEVWIRDLETGETRNVFGEGMYALTGDWSPDGTKLLAADFRNNSDSSIHLIDLETGEAPEVTPHDEDGVYVPGPWAADGSGFYLLTDEGREFRGARVLRPRSGPLRVGRERPRRTSRRWRVSGDGRVLAWLVNEDGWARPEAARPGVRGRPPRSRAPGRRAAAPDRLPAAASALGRRLARRRHPVGTAPPPGGLGRRRPGRAARVRSRRAGSACHREDELADVELITYPTLRRARDPGLALPP